MASSMGSKACDKEIAYYIEDQSREARLRYQEKLKYNKGLDSLPDPYKLSNGWINDMAVWPDITFGDIYSYLIDSPGVYTKQSLKAYKSLDAFKYVQSGHVHEVVYNPIKEGCPFAFLKAEVTPSQRLSQKPHQPWICVSKESGTIYCAHCTCMAGLGEVCSHVAAVLFKVQIAVHMGLTTKSSTSEICKWNNSFRKEVEPKSIQELQDVMRVGNRSKPVETVVASSGDPLPSEAVLESLKKICPTATFFTTIPPVGPPPSVKAKENQRSDIDKTPVTLTSLHRKEFEVTEDKDVVSLCDEVWRKYSVTTEQANYVEKTTRDQNVCQKWFEHRKGRITASTAHDVFVRKESTKPENLVKKILGYQSYDLSKTKAVRWGLDNEDIARKQYEEAMKSVHDDFSVCKSGLLIDTRKPFLGASADGSRQCMCCGKGTIEIKCPFKHKERLINEAAKCDKTFCLDNDLKLKRAHKYYTQVQMQMCIARVQFCDFIVYTSKDMIINVIPFDPEFTARIIKKCEAFFMQCVLPELLTKKIARSLSDCSNHVDDQVYCICQEPAYGRMIQCANEDCPNEWYHFQCMNIRRKPRGTWHCPACKA